MMLFLCRPAGAISQPVHPDSGVGDARVHEQYIAGPALIVSSLFELIEHRINLRAQSDW